jgi:hypothetical protein
MVMRGDGRENSRSLIFGRTGAEAAASVICQVEPTEKSIVPSQINHRKKIFMSFLRFVKLSIHLVL